MLQTTPQTTRQPGALYGEIFVVDDDSLVRETMSIVFERAGYRVTTFCDGMSFVAAARERIPSCVLMDICMPGMSGLDVLRRLDAPNYPAPIIIVSGRGDVPRAVEAIKNGASGFIEKHMDFDLIVAKAGKTIDAWVCRPQKIDTSDIRWRQFPGRLHLTRREVEVLAQIVAGESNKSAAMNLKISSRTIEIHRAHIMKKIGAKNVADLFRIVLNGNDRAAQRAGPPIERDRIMRI
jgi:FixJ family two-component response regulator